MPPGLAAATATQETATGREDSRAQPPAPPPSTSGWVLSQQRPHYQTGQDWGWGAAGGFPHALPVVPVCVCLHPGPTIIYNISIPSHHTVQTRQRWEGNSRETKLRVVSVALYFNHRRPTQVQRTVHLMNKRNKRKWVFTSHFNSHRRKLDGDPQYGNGGEPSPHQHS